MRIIKKVSQMQNLAKVLHGKGKSMGFVPTMGALHEGHLSLMRRARKENDVVIVSIFVNPTQFGPAEDCRRYPRNLKKDAELCNKIGVGYIFAPSVNEMYPDGYSTYINIEGNFTEVLEGKSRPGHFRGVATVVAKLFNIIQPDRAYFGQKDYQQLLLVKKMVEDLNIPLKIISCPTIRESDGLAMSSRNVYLGAEERKSALILNQVLESTRKSLKYRIADARRMEDRIIKIIKKEPKVKIDYVEIRDWKDLRPVKIARKGCVILVAVWIGKTRLIDNVII